MQGVVNILKTLNKVQIHGFAPALTVVTSFDNCKDIQDSPELHVQFKKGLSVLKLGPVCVDEDEHRSKPTQPGPDVHDAIAIPHALVMEGQASKRSKWKYSRIPPKYCISLLYIVPLAQL